tara:strand:- start:64823 stop:65815 length:993 start_codon:yes stop_codon:yes gene_type:complete
MNYTKDQLAERSFPKEVQFAIGVIDEDKKITFGFEKKRKWKEIKNDTSIFEIGSISKVFTSFLLTQAEERGLLQIADTIQHDLDIEWKVTQPITYEMLSNHTSGLPRIPSNMIKAALLNPEDPYADYDEEALVSYLESDMKVSTDPGEAYAYSNLGAGLLAYLVCKKLDKSYEDALQEMIFSILEMNSSSTDISTYDEAQVVQGLDKKGEPTSNWNFKSLAGAGAIKSNVADMQKFMYSQMNDNIVEIEKLQTKTFEGDQFDLALGWHIIKEENWFWHNGGTGGYKSSMVIDPNNKKGIVILTNISSGHKDAQFIDQLVFMLMKKISNNE